MVKLYKGKLSGNDNDEKKMWKESQSKQFAQREVYTNNVRIYY